MKDFGVISRGLIMPLVQEGDDLAKIVADKVIGLHHKAAITLQTKDVLAITESVVARTQGNYAKLSDISDCIYNTYKNQEVGICFPILSRNRFVNLLKGLTKHAKKVYLQLSFPADEVGNHFITEQELFDKKISTTDSFTEKEFRKVFPNIKHKFTGIDYINLYKQAVGKKCEIIMSNNPCELLKYTKNIIAANIHERFITKAIILKKDKKAKVTLLSDILTKPNKGSGFNKDYGILGSNFSTDNKIKLFPRNCFEFCKRVQSLIYKATGIKIEVMVYGDGAFKDPVGKIWELADPVVSPGYTPGLVGTPNELKLKMYIDNAKNQKDKAKLLAEVQSNIKNKAKNLVGTKTALGTTPRQLTDLLGSLSDLTSGSGDKGTPVILIQNYFKNYTDK
ncbi:MAG: coenzyme F420-0:L-glutamate ligase [Mycoplasmoidaceae bacterium]